MLHRRIAMRSPERAFFEHRARHGGSEHLMRPTLPSDVLIVDDDIDTADLLHDVLLCVGIDSVAVYSVADALEQVNDTKPCCILLDVNMPGRDGLDLARAVRTEHGSSIVLVAISGASHADDRAAKTFEIVDHHFQKPVDFAQLLQILRASLPVESN